MNQFLYNPPGLNQTHDQSQLNLNQSQYMSDAGDFLKDSRRYEKNNSLQLMLQNTTGKLRSGVDGVGPSSDR